MKISLAISVSVECNSESVLRQNAYRLVLLQKFEGIYQAVTFPIPSSREIVQKLLKLDAFSIAGSIVRVSTA